MTEQKTANASFPAQCSDTELQNFVYIVSHDLQAPVRHVNTFLSMLLSDHSESLDDDAQHLITNAISGSLRLNAMIQSLLTYSRIETEGTEFSIIDLNEILDDSIKRIDTNKKIKFVDPKKILPSVLADRQQICLLFDSLISNAIEHNDKEAIAFNVISGVDNEFTTIDFIDEGTIIDDKYREMIFEMFHRLSGKNDTHMGVGLAIARRIARRHGGNLILKQLNDEQNCFRLTLPKPS